MTNQSLFQLLNAMVGYLESIRLACGRSGFDPRSGQSSVVKTGSDSSTAKCLATGVIVLGYDYFKGMARVTVCVAR